MRRHGIMGLSVAALLLVMSFLTGCGDGDEPDRAGAGTTGDGPEVAEITVGVLPNTHFAPVYYADERGFFSREGLDVTLEPVQGGAVAVQLLTSDELQFSVANYLGFTQAVSNGAPLRLVAAGTAFADGEAFIFTGPDSPIRSMADLDGRTLATNTLNSPGDILPQAIADDLGLDIEMEFVEVPQPEIVAAVESGSVDAAFMAEPNVARSRAAGLRSIQDISTGTTANLPVAGYMTSAPFAEQNPNTVAAFRRAIEAASAELGEDEAAARAFIPTYSQLPPPVASEIVLPIYATSLDPAELQRVADLMSELELVEQPVRLDEFAVAR